VIFLKPLTALKETLAMTAPSSIDPLRFLDEQLASASPDLLRSMLTTFINTLVSAEADAVCGAGYGQSSPDRVNVRNVTGRGSSTPALARSRSRSRSCAPGRTSLIGCWSAAGGPNAR
jgi:hypothetical protein